MNIEVNYQVLGANKQLEELGFESTGKRQDYIRRCIEDLNRQMDESNELKQVDAVNFESVDEAVQVIHQVADSLKMTEDMVTTEEEHLIYEKVMKDVKSALKSTSVNRDAATDKKFCLADEKVGYTSWIGLITGKDEK